MIAIWMLYCLGIGLAFVVVGHALERALHFAGGATRWAWVVALVGSYAIPAAAWFRPDAFPTFVAPVPVNVESRSSSPAPAASPTSTSLETPSRPFTLSDLDTALRWSWGITSLAILIALGTAATRLVSVQRRWRRTNLDGRSVLVSTNVGPAVVGVWSPRLVLPEWALSLPASDRELMLAHEEQHMRAADPALLALGFVLVLFAPWNLALWWQWRRLRLAVEMDCDARVLAEGRSAAAYGELLLNVGRRRSVEPLGAAAFGEPASFLESRIRRMLRGLPRWRWAGVVAAMVVAAGAVVAACETPRPLGPSRESTLLPTPSSSRILAVVGAVIEPADVDRAPAAGPDATADFPDLPRLAGIEGRVVLQARVDMNGRVDAGSVTVLQSPHPALAQAAKSAVVRAHFRPAQAQGRPVSAVVRISYDFVNAPSTPQGARELTDRLAVLQAERVRPWVESNARRMFPTILEPSGPPADAFLVHDARLQVYRSALTTLNYLADGGKRSDKEIDVATLKAALPSFRPGNDAWGVVDPRALRGLVRDNVRVIWIHHEPQVSDTGLPKAPRALDARMQEVHVQAEELRRLAQTNHPEVFGRPGSQTAVALVLDANHRVLAHAARAGEARGADGRYFNGEACRQVLERLLPLYKNTQWSVSGCADVAQQPNVIIYWGIPLLPLAR